MKINRNNYEAYFIDYLEGNLDEKLVNDFIEFLQQNPELKEELSLFETVSIGQEEITFNKKELLLKEKYDVEQVFNEAAIAKLEGEISLSEKAEFEKYLTTHPEKQKEADLYKLTKLQPDTSVVFSKKYKIYKRQAGRTVLLWSMRVAAVIVVALSVYAYIETNKGKIIIENQVAITEKATEKNVNSPEIKETVNSEIQPIVKEVKEKPAIRSAKPKPEIINIVDEKLPDNNQFASIRTQEYVPDKLESANLSLYAKIPQPDLVFVKTAIPVVNDSFQDEVFLVDVIKEKTGIGKLTIGKITKAGLTLVANLSKEKFNYETNTEGKVTEINYDSRILAFSIPTKNEIVRK